LKDAASEQTRALIRRALEQYRTGELDAALSSVRAARRADPHLAVTLQMEAQICLDRGDREGYLRSLRSVVLASPQSARLQSAVGRLLVQAGQFEEGVAALKTAIALSPQTSEYVRDLAAAHLSRGQIETAADVLAQALEQTPDDELLAIALARLHESRENWESAAFYYEVALKNDPENLVWRRQLARSLYQLGEYDRASRQFADCLADDGSAISLAEHVQYGDACLRIGDFARAEHVFDQVARCSQYRLKEIELLRGFCALNQGRTTHAKGIFNTALFYWPEDKTLREAISLCDAARTEP
jgi:tetratricopeptide (TPR) repeat protein